jgi:putative endonuclease
MDDRERKRIGRDAEEAALAHLRASGLRLVLRNYRCRAGELDLVMIDRDTLVIVEVRHRSDDRFGDAAASITWRKQRRLAAAAGHLLLRRADLRHYPARFDVVAITTGCAGREIKWIRDAFST